MATVSGELRARLLKLNWGRGLTPREMLEQAPDLPVSIVEQLPPDFRFREPGEVMSYVRHLYAHGVLPDDPSLAPTAPPSGYGNSPTGRTFRAPETGHGVGSGAASGYTGSDAQTGEGRQGVDYTDED